MRWERENIYDHTNCNNQLEFNASLLITLPFKAISHCNVMNWNNFLGCVLPYVLIEIRCRPFILKNCRKKFNKQKSGIYIKKYLLNGAHA